MKRFFSFSLAFLLTLSLFATGATAAVKPKDPEPTPTPEITIQPLDPERPGQSPAELQDDPPNPRPIVLG